jgi:hypothetical protein
LGLGFSPRQTVFSLPCLSRKKEEEERTEKQALTIRREFSA